MPNYDTVRRLRPDYANASDAEIEQAITSVSRIDRAEIDQGDFARGLGNYVEQVPGMVGAVEALAGEGLRRTVGEGQVGNWLREDGLRRMKESQAAQKHKLTDEFDKAYEKGLGGLADWGQYQAGNLIGNLVELGAATLTGGVGGVGIATARKVAKDQVMKMAAAGATVGQIASAAKNGFGEVGGNAIEQKGLENVEFEKVVPAALGHTALEFVGDKILAKGITGAGGSVTNVADVGVKRALAENVLKQVAPAFVKEGATELGQTALERAAADQSLDDSEAQRQYLNSFMAGGAMGGMAGGVGGVKNTLMSNLTQPDSPASVRAGEAAGAAAGKALDAIGRAARPKVASADFLMFANPLPEGLDDQQLHEAANVRNTAAVSFAKKVMAEGSHSTPEEMDAAAKFLSLAQAATEAGQIDAAVAQFRDDFKAVNGKQESKQGFMDGLTSFLGATQRKGSAQSPRGMAQEVAQGWMQRNAKLTEIFPNLDVNDAQVRNGAQALFDWVSDGMPNFDHASVALVQMWGQNAPEMLRSAYHAAASEGIAPKDFERMGKAVNALTQIVKKGDPRRNQLAMMVRESMQDQLTTADIAQWDRTLQNYSTNNSSISDKDVRAALKRDFGAFADDVLALYERAPEELLQDEFADDVQEQGGVKQAGRFDMRDKDAKQQMTGKLSELNGTGEFAYKIGAWSQLKRDFKDFPEALREQENKLLAENGYTEDDLKAYAQQRGESVEKMRDAVLAGLNKRWQHVESRERTETDPVDLNEADVESMTHRRKDDHGRFTLQRVVEDKSQSVVDPETGETTFGTKTEPFHVNAGSIIATMRRKLGQERDSSNKAAENHRLLTMGVASLMNTEQFTGDVTGLDDSLNDPYTGMSYKQMREAVLADDSDISPLNILRTKYREVVKKAKELGADDPAGQRLMKFAVMIRKTVDSKDQKKINELVRSLRGWEDKYENNETDARTKRDDVVPSEVDDIGEIQRDAHGNSLSMEPDPRQLFDSMDVSQDTKPTPAAERMNMKQINFVFDNLKKGVPAFVAAVNKASVKQKQRIIKALNELISNNELGELQDRAETALEQLRDELVVRQSTQSAGKEPISDAQQQAVRDELVKTLGDKIKLAFEKIIRGNKKGQEWSGEWTEGAIKISLKALDPLGVGRHEAMHQLMSWLRKAKADGVEDVLKAVASNAMIQRQLHRMLQNDPAALEQLKDPEEAAAYLYQFWRAGKINLGPKVEGFFNRAVQFLRELTGLLSREVRDLQHAEQILQAFEGGAFAGNNTQAMLDLDAQIKSDRDSYANNLWNAFIGNDVLRKVAFTAGDVLRDTKVPALTRLADLLYTPEGAKMGQQSFFDAVPQQRGVWLNKLNAIFRGVEKEDADLIRQYLQKRTDAKKIHDEYIREKVEAVRSYLGEMYDYAQQRGVKRFNDETQTWESMGKININYFPRVFDIDKVLADRVGFTQILLDNHKSQLASMAQANNVSVEEIAEHIVDRIINAQGNPDITESTSQLGITPAASAVNKRDLVWLKDEFFIDYMNEDISDILTSYTMQMVKRAEYTSRFGNEGEVIQKELDQTYAHMAFDGDKRRISDAYDKLDDLEQKYHEKRAQGVEVHLPTLRDAVDALATGEEITKALQAIQMPIKAIMAAEGTIGRDISDTFRNASSMVMFYQNLRLLTLSLFSSFIDPLGIVVRGGSIDDAYQGFVRGIKEIKAQIKGEYNNDELTQLAERLGTVDAGSYLDALGQTYSSLYMTGKVKHLNDKLFKWNGMEAWNRAMRIQATQAAIGFIEKHLSKPTEHSKRYLEELGLTPQSEFSLDDPKIQQAVVRWVNGAILRPNAMQRPIYASDPHYALLYHLKQFTYSFHKTILQRAFVEAQHGNLTPAVSLVGLYVPMMIAADVLKEVLAPGDEPAWMKAGLGSAVSHGVMRANLMGVPQFAVESFTTPFGKEGAFGTVDSGTKLFGPTVEQIFDWLMVPLTEKYSLGETAVRSMPHTPVFSRLLL